jgi:large subunit ribosomal protein L15
MTSLLRSRLFSLPISSCSSSFFSSSSLLRSFPSLPLVFTRSFSGKAAPPLISQAKLSNIPGSTKPRKRVGRGPGSGMGKTATRGHKGKKARNAPNKGPWFEGGQTPLYKKIPKWGFNNYNRRNLVPVNLDRIIDFVNQKRIDPSEIITMKTLYEARLARQVKFGVKLLAGKVKSAESIPKLNLELTDSSLTAKSLIEQAGGSIKHVWFNRVTLRAHLRPHRFEILPRSNGIPPPRLRASFGYDLSGKYIGEEEATKQIDKVKEARIKAAHDKAKLKIFGPGA